MILGVGLAVRVVAITRILTPPQTPNSPPPLLSSQPESISFSSDGTIAANGKGVSKMVVSV